MEMKMIVLEQSPKHRLINNSDEEAYQQPDLGEFIRRTADTLLDDQHVEFEPDHREKAYRVPTLTDIYRDKEEK